jgi:hypothetical protein
LTGSSDIKELPKRVDDRALRSIVGRAANFEVTIRYKTVLKLKSALQTYESGTMPRPIWAALAAAVLVLCFFAGGMVVPTLSERINEYFGTTIPVVHEFSDPLIEQAIRLSLGKAADEPVYTHELLGVEGIFIASDKVFATANELHAYTSEHHSAGKSPLYAQFQSITDIAACINLKDLIITYNALTDISFLADHVYLRDITLSKTSVRDISAIRNFSVLKRINLEGCQISDLSPIKDCPLIGSIELNRVVADNYDFLNEGAIYDKITLCNVDCNGFLQSFSGITVRTLILNECGIESFDMFPDMMVTEKLELQSNDLVSTDGAERIVAGTAEIIM